MGDMRISEALRQLWPSGEITQAAVAEKLAPRFSEEGLNVDQTKVSAWLRGRTPSFTELSAIEDAFGKPRGWVLATAGVLDPAALNKKGAVKPLAASAGGALAGAEQEIRELIALVKGLEPRLVQVETQGREQAGDLKELAARLGRVEQSLPRPPGAGPRGGPQRGRGRPTQ